MKVILMDIKIKRWTALGLGAAFAAGTLAACNNATENDAPDTAGVETPAPTDRSVEESALPPVGEAPEPAAASGEGEGGVNFAVAATDPVVFNSALAIAEAHVIAARDAYAAGETDAAAEMYAHPVSEVLFEMEPAFQARGVADFTPLFTEASVAAIQGAPVEEINQLTDDIIAKLREVSAAAPESDMSKSDIALGVIVDQVDRAVHMYGVASESDAYEPYLDGYGFYKAAEAAFFESQTDITIESQEAGLAALAAINLLSMAYPDATRPDRLGFDQSKLAVAASNLALAASE